jgi:ubiquinone/menaquinone biosynthesis C-methylase UbiE
MTKPMNSRDLAAVTQRPYLGPMSRRWLLPLYDPFSLLLGARTAHASLVEAAELRPGHRVLEIGCGTGNLALLAKARQPAATVVGLDPDAAALARARLKARRRGLELLLDRGFADQLPHPDASFDRVLSALMLHHLPGEEKPAALREVVRVLRPGGELHLVDIAQQDGGHGRLRRHHGPHARNSPGTSVADLVGAAGFTDVRMGTVRTGLGLSLVAARAVR